MELPERRNKSLLFRYRKTNQNHKYIWRGVTLSYAEDGKLLKVVGEQDHFIEFIYKNEKLKSIQDDTGRNVHYQYSGKEINEVIDLMGEKEYYFYDSHNYIVKKKDRNGNLSPKNYYDEKGRIIRQQMTDGSEITYQYIEKKACCCLAH